MFHLDLFPPVGHVCSVCASKTDLKFCTGCRVVQYCGEEHQREHRKKHRVACNGISRSAVQLSEIDCTQVSSYSEAKYQVVDSLLQISTVDAIEKALEHCMNLLELCPKDDLRIRDIVPNLLVRLGREQDCYDFIKWWSFSLSTKPALARKAGRFLSIKEANALEPITMLDLDSLSLCNLATLTLIKTRLYLDVLEHRRDDDLDGLSGLVLGYRSNSPDPLARDIGELARKAMDIITFDEIDVQRQIDGLEDEWQSLCSRTYNANPYFWDLLASNSKPDHVKVAQCLPGSEQEAILASRHCKAAWDESEDALTVVQSTTCKFTKLYKSPDEPAGLEMKRGTGRVFAGLFTSSELPHTVFPPTQIAGSQEIRFVHVRDDKKVLVFVDGACSNNGQPNPRAGWAVVYRPRQPGQDQGSVSGRLETKGPFGEEFTATSNRAELRAVIAALRLCDWTDTKCNTLVVATDSAHVVDGMTRWVKSWVKQKWRLSDGGKVKNRDLWELLLGEIERCDALGFKVELWKIPRGENAAADNAAKNACELPAKDEFSDATTYAPCGAGQGPAFLALALDFIEPESDSYLSMVLAKREMKIARSEDAALSVLAHTSCPLVIIAADGALTSHKVLAERVIDSVRKGATLVMTGTCLSFVSPAELDRLFTMMGLPAKFDSYTRHDIKLQEDAVGSRLPAQRDAEIYLKALFLRGMPKSTMWYVAKEDPELSPLLFAPLGQGNVGVIGDVTGNESIKRAFMAMCGL